MIAACRLTAHPGYLRGRFLAESRPVDYTSAMKQLIVIVRPFLADRVLDTLKNAPVEACFVREVKGFGRQKSYLDEYRDSEYSLAYLPKIEITVWVDDARAGEVARSMVEAARTGRMGDGKVFFIPAVPNVEKPIEF